MSVTNTYQPLEYLEEENDAKGVENKEEKPLIPKTQRVLKTLELNYNTCILETTLNRGD